MLDSNGVHDCTPSALASSENKHPIVAEITAEGSPSRSFNNEAVLEGVAGSRLVQLMYRMDLNMTLSSFA